MGLSPLKLGGLVASFLATSGSLASSHAIADRRREDCFAPWQPSTLLFVVAHASIIRVSSLFLEMSITKEDDYSKAVRAGESSTGAIAPKKTVKVAGTGGDIGACLVPAS